MNLPDTRDTHARAAPATPLAARRFFPRRPATPHSQPLLSAPCPADDQDVGADQFSLP